MGADDMTVGADNVTVGASDVTIGVNYVAVDAGDITVAVDDVTMGVNDVKSWCWLQVVSGPGLGHGEARGSAALPPQTGLASLMGATFCKSKIVQILSD
ncbi:hypothetical protein scyTo_0015756 [Scyliorhinus torazame]|uniref:Uncharacterized protein n=1 Tax=Scyliorhinus torazame TaxID=75743 RepID=A0A401PY45_SCYTO|nr:hypothetical protein [Scyliorhinus torazame]